MSFELLAVGEHRRQPDLELQPLDLPSALPMALPLPATQQQQQQQQQQDDDAQMAQQLQFQYLLESDDNHNLDPELLRRARAGDRVALDQAIAELQGAPAAPAGLQRQRPQVAGVAAAAAAAGAHGNPNGNAELQNALERRSVFDSKPFIAMLIAYGLIEISFSLATLMVSSDKSCDRPLRFFVLAFSLRQAALIPINVRRFLDPNGFVRVEDVQRRAWVQIFWLVCFIIGHLWVYSSETCADTDPVTYWWSFTLIILVYIDLCFPVLLLFIICTCWPCIAIVWRRMQPNPGASDAQIRGLPVRRFDPQEMRKRRQEHRRARKAASLAQQLLRAEHSTTSAVEQHPHQEEDDGMDLAHVRVDVIDPENPPLPTEAKRNDPSSLTVPGGDGNKGVRESPSVDGDSGDEEDELTCSICLQEFESGEQLICLPCSHDFHKKCCESWLKLHSTCPLCRKNVAAP